MFNTILCRCLGEKHVVTTINWPAVYAWMMLLPHAVHLSQ